MNAILVRDEADPFETLSVDDEEESGVFRNDDDASDSDMTGPEGESIKILSKGNDKEPFEKTLNGKLSSEAVISTSTNMDAEELMPLNVVVPQNYNPEIVPKPQRGPVEVKLRILLEQIYGVKQLERTITVGIRTFCLWKDPRLKFDPSVLGSTSMDYFQVNPTTIWTPSVSILNVVESHTTYQSARVYPDGSVFLTTRMMSIVTVHFAAQWFPFDRQSFVFEFGEIGHSKDVVYLNTTATSWEPAFSLSASDEDVERLERIVEDAGSHVRDGATEQSERIQSAEMEETFKDSVEVLQKSNFILGVAVLEDDAGDSYWVVDNFTGWQGLHFGEGARYYYVGVSTLLEMHRGRLHFILVYILPLVFIITVSEANWFFDVRDLDPRLTIASGLLLCMVAFQYTIEQELPKVSYPLWINYYMVGCYVMIVLQCGLMVLAVLIAGPSANGNHWTRRSVENTTEKMSTDRCEDVRKREELADRFNRLCAIVYPSFFVLFNVVMFGLVYAYT